VDPDGASDYLYYGAGAAYNYAFTENAGLSIYLNWYAADEDMMGDMGRMNKDNKLTYGISFTAGF
jgi:hypothetical protein